MNRILFLLRRYELVNSDNENIVIFGLKQIKYILQDVSLALCCGILIENIYAAIAYLVSFWLLRIYAGGYPVSYTHLDASMLRQFVANFQDMEKELKELTKTFLNDSAVNSRLRDVGFLTKQQAHDLGAVGPFMRASGIALDNRKLGYAAYSDLNFEPVTSDVGDCYARCDVRIREIFQSIDLIRQAASKIPGGEVAVPFKGFPEGEYFMREEQPRGEMCIRDRSNSSSSFRK